MEEGGVGDVAEVEVKSLRPLSRYSRRNVLMTDQLRDVCMLSWQAAYGAAAVYLVITGRQAVDRNRQ